ncbi:hypothetical protein [Salinibaculum rarum]|uniref:hypothetical protein n=1 Tax=Salinibaculum rarum TaxID=3058903 RepID=UPI00265ED75B|nr:hypothetical protein [Salinibaculum sp. KK48]
MKQKLLALLLVGVLITTAGCSGLTGTDTTAPNEDTAMGVEDSDPSTETVTGDNLPAGVTTNGIQNSTKLIDTHIEQLNGTAYRSKIAVNSGYSELDNSSSTTSSGAEQVNIVEVIEPSEDQHRIDITGIDKNGVRRTSSIWKNGKYLNMDRSDAPQGANYTRTHGMGTANFITSVGKFTAYAYLNSSMQQLNYSVAGMTTVNGQDVVELTATQETQLDGESAKVESTMHITPDGVILGSTVTTPTKDSPLAEYEVTDYGSATAEKPEWMQNIPAVTADFSENNKLITLTHNGGAPVADGTSISVRQGVSLSGATTLSQLDSGEKAYLYYANSTDSDSQQLQVSTTKPSDLSNAVSLDDGKVNIVLNGDVSIQLTYNLEN